MGDACRKGGDGINLGALMRIVDRGGAPEEHIVICYRAGCPLEGHLLSEEDRRETDANTYPQNPAQIWVDSVTGVGMMWYRKSISLDGLVCHSCAQGEWHCLFFLTSQGYVICVWLLYLNWAVIRGWEAGCVQRSVFETCRRCSQVPG